MRPLRRLAGLVVVIVVVVVVVVFVVVVVATKCLVKFEGSDNKGAAKSRRRSGTDRGWNQLHILLHGTLDRPMCGEMNCMFIA